ncbi:MAG: arginine/lysine/histidine transport system permease protein [Thermotoga sp.]|jgi:polar amino acid transport system permease protein|nr:arginine/lysine/histidine transport system permease protein [Thermotoga sp.]
MPEWLSVIVDNLPLLLKGALSTLQLTSLAVLIGLAIGIFVGMGRLSKYRIIRYPSSVYVEFLRGTPLMVQLFLVYFGLPELGLEFDRFTAAVVALGINSGAYVAEIVRAGIQSVPKGQYEAARSLGMSHAQAMIYVILPQAFRHILPALGNEFIALAKDSSLAMVIGTVELMRSAQYIVSRTFMSFPIYGGVALIYFAITFSVSRLVKFVEGRLKV